MKNIAILTIAITTMFVSCDQNSSKEVKDAEAKIAIAKQELIDIKRNENDSIKANTAKEWKEFRIETTTELARLDEDVKKFDSSLVTMNARDKQKLNADYYQAKNDITGLRNKLNQKSASFDNDMEAFGERAEQENKAFRQHFKDDLGKLDQAVKKLFRDNKI